LRLIKKLFVTHIYTFGSNVFWPFKLQYLTMFFQQKLFIFIWWRAWINFMEEKILIKYYVSLISIMLVWKMHKLCSIFNFLMFKKWFYVINFFPNNVKFNLIYNCGMCILFWKCNHFLYSKDNHFVYTFDFLYLKFINVYM
jgi:hypothetical protein